MVITSSAWVSLWQRSINGKPTGKLVNKKYKRHDLRNKVQLSSILGHPLCNQSTLIEQIPYTSEIPIPEPVRRPVIVRVTSTEPWRVPGSLKPIIYRSTIYRNYLFGNTLPNYRYMLSHIFGNNISLYFIGFLS